MTLLRLTFLPLFALSTACTDLLNRGSPCGGTLEVDAEAVLPDTGLGAGGRASISFSETNHALDESSLIVWTFPPSNTTFTDGPPRVRVLTTDGRIFLDLEATAAYMGSWYVRRSIPSGPVRDEIVAAFQSAVGVVEYSSRQPSQKVTRVRPDVRFAGRSPVLRCL